MESPDFLVPLVDLRPDSVSSCIHRKPWDFNKITGDSEDIRHYFATPGVEKRMKKNLPKFCSEGKEGIWGSDHESRIRL